MWPDRSEPGMLGPLILIELSIIVMWGVSYYTEPALGKLIGGIVMGLVPVHFLVIEIRRWFEERKGETE